MQPVMLLVEDDEALRSVLTTLMELAGYVVIAAGDGAQALTVMSAVTELDLVLLDMQLPIVDGATIRRAQLADATLREIPTIVITATRLSRATVASLGAPVLMKPFDCEVLIALAARLLSQRPRIASPTEDPSAHRLQTGAA